MEWIWIKNSCKSHLFQTARNFPTVKATHILKKIASWIIFHCEIYIYIYLNFQVFILFNSILFNSIFKKKKNSIFNFRETLCSFSFRDNQMQNIWNKAYFYQLHQPKAPQPPNYQCWLVSFGQKQYCRLGKGWSGFLPIYFAFDCSFY